MSLQDEYPYTLRGNATSRDDPNLPAVDVELRFDFNETWNVPLRFQKILGLVAPPLPRSPTGYFFESPGYPKLTIQRVRNYRGLFEGEFQEPVDLGNLDHS